MEPIISPDVIGNIRQQDVIRFQFIISFIVQYAGKDATTTSDLVKVANTLYDEVLNTLAGINDV